MFGDRAENVSKQLDLVSAVSEDPGTRFYRA